MNGHIFRPARRLRTALGVMIAVVMMSAAPAGPALAIPQPPEPGGPPPADGTPGPEYPTTQSKGCQAAGVMASSDLMAPPPASEALNLKQAWTLSQGAGVTVAILDTGVHPSSRLPNLVGGGDYVSAGGDGLTDCDAHGTLIAGVIAASPAPTDGFEGVAPQARLISIRWRSGAFDPQLPGGGQDLQTTMELHVLARAIVHAANLGAGVIVIPLPICIDASHSPDETDLGAAVSYAVHQRGAVVIAGAGDAGQGGCNQNPDVDPSHPADTRNWSGVKTISTPGWFSPDVLGVGYTNAAGMAMPGSLYGPWVAVAAPGTPIESLDPGGGGVVNGVGPTGQLVPVGGASFAAAYVAGTAALLRARFPTETPADIADRLEAAAHPPARGVDNALGAGVIDPVAALGYLTPPTPPRQLYLSAPLPIPKPPRPPDRTPAITATAVIVAVIVLGGVGVYVSSSVRRRP